ncbi:MAG TPA: hypothetical protein EYP55_10380 [Anaerolineae bacterium]|nr:hypothetical protein [Anaerolineae bacterium]
MGGYRHRWMYYMTGLPGWMRFGFSPGWLGRSPTGLGPCAEYLMTGQWPTPQMAAAWQVGPWMGWAAPWGYPAPGTIPPEQEIQMLKSQAEALKAQLDRISARLAELEEASQ